MSVRLLAGALLGVLLTAQGCALQQPTPLDAAQVRDSERAVRQNIRRQRARLFEIAYALRVGGAGRCPEKMLFPDAGLLLESADDPSSPVGLEVRYVVPGSPLALAGVQAGDILLELDGRPATGVDDFNKRLAVRARLTLQRGSERYQAGAEIARVCGVPVQLADDPSLMTFQQESAVAVPYGLLESASDDWLAIAIAHQIAHALLEVTETSVADPEATADESGLILAAESGFDVGAAPAFWEWLAGENPWRIPSTRAFRLRRPHPTLETDMEYPTSQLHLGIGHRLPAIRAKVDQILALQGRGG